MTPQRMAHVMQQVGIIQGREGAQLVRFSHADFCKCYSHPRATLRACMCSPAVMINGKSYRVNSRTGDLEAQS